MRIVMSTTHGSHPSDDELELYALGRMSDDAIAPLEEHLLLCESCRDRLDEADAFTTTICAALRENEVPRNAEERHSSFFARLFSVPVPVWAGGLAAIALLFVFAPWRTASLEPVAVQLETFRGAGTPSAAMAPAGRPLLLNVDAKGLPQNTSYRVEVADSQGAPVWTSSVPAKGETFVVSINRSLGSGHYWMRIYQDDASGELLREFALQLN